VVKTQFPIFRVEQGKIQVSPRNTVRLSQESWFNPEKLGENPFKVFPTIYFPHLIFPVFFNNRSNNIFSKIRVEPAEPDFFFTRQNCPKIPHT